MRCVWSWAVWPGQEYERHKYLILTLYNISKNLSQQRQSVFINSGRASSAVFVDGGRVNLMAMDGV
jgi:hypothetical protein